MSPFNSKVAAAVVSGALALSTSLTSTAAFAEPVLENTTQEFIDVLSASGGPAIYTLTPAEARNVLAGAQSGDVAKPAIDITDTVFGVGPTGATKVRIIRPAGNTDRLPVIVYFHGAGWVMGDTGTHDRLVRELAVRANAALVFVDYERSPRRAIQSRLSRITLLPNMLLNMVNSSISIRPVWQLPVTVSGAT